jgi:hypothetical protein
VEGQASDGIWDQVMAGGPHGDRLDVDALRIG